LPLFLKEPIFKSMKWSDVFLLNQDTDKLGTIESIRNGVEFKGTNVWALIIAIIIASIGLNVNSTAVIIGAMLISPLMGPIAGAGMALGMYDTGLLRKSLINLGIMTGISLLASYIYFSLSPLGGAQSELLSRTTPTFYDVLIAVFGGSAMIISVSRKNRSTNAIAGVAIATALMPPLCTAGFGLASKNMSYFFGAMYLYLINSVFIGLATFVFTKYLKLGKEVQGEGAKLTRNHVILSIVAAIVFIAPSIYMGYDMIQETTFRNNVDNFLASAMKFRDSTVLNVEKQRTQDANLVEVTIVGTPLTRELVNHLGSLLPEYGLSKARLRIFQSGGAYVVDSSGIIEETTGASALENYTAQASSAPISTGTDTAANASVMEALAEIRKEQARQAESATSLQASPSPSVSVPVPSQTTASYKRQDFLDTVKNEIELLFPEISKIAWADLASRNNEPLDSSVAYTVYVRWDEGTEAAKKNRFLSWLRLRLENEHLQIQDF